MARIRGLLSGVADGVGGVLMVTGEQGIGKSALLREGLSGAQALGCWVGWGVADELRQRFPLGLMVECLGPAGQRAAAGDDGGWAVAGPLLAGDPVSAAAERLLALVDRLCAVSPVVLVAEDLQWADEASLLAWRRLVRAAGQLPLLVVGSLRSAPVREEAGQLARAAAASGGAVLELGPLPAGQVAELAGDLLGAAPGRRLAGVLARAGGNPLYVTELAAALARAGRVQVTGGSAELVGEPGGVRVPVSLAAAIGERLAGLPGPTAGALRWAAVLGSEFSVTDLGVVTGSSAGDLAEMMEQAMAAAVVAEAGLRLGFRHGLIRQVLYERVPEPVRAALHLEAARVLAGAGAPAEQVATQLVAAPDASGEWVWTWLEETAKVLASRAPDVTAQLLRRALAQIPAADPRREVLETIRITVAYVLMRDEEAELAARPLLARTTDPDRAADVSLMLARTLARTARPAEAAAVVADALGRPGLSPAWAARLQAQRAQNLVNLGEWNHAARVAGQALAQAERCGDRFAAGYALHVLSVVSFHERDHDAFLRQADQALKVLGDDLQTADLRLILLANKAGGLENLDRIAEAGATLQEALVLAEQSGTPHLGLISTAAADYYLGVGQWDDALAVLEATVGVPGPAYLSILTHGQAALIAAHRDDWEKAQEHLAAVSDQVVDSPQTRSVAYCLLRARALAAERAGRPEEAVAALVSCLDPVAAADMAERYELLPQLTRLALAAGDTATAAAAAQGAAQEADRGPMPVKAAAAALCQGLVDGDPAPVLAAAAYYQSTGRSFERAQALEDAAALLAGNGDVPAARRAFSDATQIYLALGAVWDLRHADARLRGYGVRRSRGGRRPSAAHGWHGLTPTETKIARLVATGQSNPDIATELYLSRNTVQTHISHILAKLNAHSRAEIIRQALEHDDARTAS